jgi:hypothetical protein
MVESRIEERNRELRRALLAFLVAFCFWQLPLLIRESADVQVTGPFAVVAALGAVLFAVSTFRLYRVQRAIAADPVAREALNDERIRQVRLRSFNVGFFALATYVGLLRLTAPVLALPMAIAAQLGITVAVVFPIAAFLLYERLEA